MNDFSQIDDQSSERDLARLECRDIEPKLTPEEITGRQLSFEEEAIALAQEWPGDGSGIDDLADLNANEASDYRDE